MAKQRILESNNNPERRDYIVAEFNEGGQRREDISAALGFANTRAMYNALVTQGWITQEKRENSDNSGEPKPRRQKGVLAVSVERWALLSAQADFVFAGGKADDFIPPDDVTPEFFFALRAVRLETPAYFSNCLDKIGGIDSDAGRALRAWAGRPLTRAQAEQEAVERESAAAATMLPKIARLLEKARSLAAQAGLPIESKISRVMTEAGLFDDDSWREKTAS